MCAGSIPGIFCFLISKPGVERRLKGLMARIAFVNLTARTRRTPSFLPDYPGKLGDLDSPLALWQFQAIETELGFQMTRSNLS